MAGFKLATHADGFKCRGGQFIWGQYSVGADFAKHDGVTLLIWKGKHDVHGTVEAEAADGFTLLGTSFLCTRDGNKFFEIGTSVQIATSLVRNVNKHLDRICKGEPTKIINDVPFQLKKLKK